MSKVTENIKQLIEQCSEAEKLAIFEYLRARLPQHPLEREWGITSDIILTAIARSSDLTQRGVRGVIAEAVFEAQTLPRLRGWNATGFTGDLPYDFLIEDNSKPPKKIRIQVKLQRMKYIAPCWRGRVISFTQRTCTQLKFKKRAAALIQRLRKTRDRTGLVSSTFWRSTCSHLPRIGTALCLRLATGWSPDRMT